MPKSKDYIEEGYDPFTAVALAMRDSGQPIGKIVPAITQAMQDNPGLLEATRSRRPVMIPNDEKTVTLDALRLIRDGMFDRRTILSFVEVEVKRLNGDDGNKSRIMDAIKRQTRRA